MGPFLAIWAGQVASKIGTGATRFALLIWAYQQTDSATAMALLSFFSYVPLVLVSPFAGTWIDRVDRRRVMWLADAGAGIASAALLLLVVGGHLAFWHLYLVQALAGASEAFQGPAFTALSTQMLPREQHARASGLRSVIGGGAALAAPILAGLLLPLAGIAGIMLLDLATFGVAVTSLLLVASPAGCLRGAATPGAQDFGAEMGGGLRYIRQRPGLMGMMGIYGVFNLLDALTWFSLLPVLVLARTGGDEMAMAAVQGAIGGAIVVGGLLVSAWGGPRRKIHGFLGGSALSFAIGGLLMAVGGSLSVWLVGAWFAALLVPVISSSSESIWQRKVPLGLQGRVFAVHNMVRQGMTPSGILLGGLLADGWFEPAMAAGGVLQGLFGPLVGTGPGAGIGVMFLATAVLAILVALVGYRIPAIYRVEEILPDHGAQTVSGEGRR